MDEPIVEICSLRGVVREYKTQDHGWWILKRRILYVKIQLDPKDYMNFNEAVRRTVDIKACLRPREQDMHKCKGLPSELEIRVPKIMRRLFPVGIGVTVAISYVHWILRYYFFEEPFMVTDISIRN